MNLIEIEPYNKNWPDMFAQEKKRILEKTNRWAIKLEHVGSTSIPGIPAKPTIDMCFVVDSLEIADQHVVGKIISLGYEYTQLSIKLGCAN